MIKSLSLHNFKCFADLQLEIGGLTLLTGLNGMGKSSVIQALLLLRQSFQQGFLNPALKESQQLLLNGELAKLGTSADVLNEFALDNEIRFDLDFRAMSLEEFDEEGEPLPEICKKAWTFYYDEKNTNTNSLKLKDEIDARVVAPISEWVEKFDGDKEIARLYQHRQRLSLESSFIQNRSLFNDGFQYLQAERYGPRVSFETSDYSVRQRRQIGSHGEFAVHFLEVFGDKEDVLESMRHANAPSEKLRSQVEAWLGEISPGTRIETTPNYGTDSVSVRFGYASESIVSRPYRATNVGFGLSYVLPILVAILSAKPGSLLLLENPEAHLHPRGQSTMGRLMALAAKAGVQIIVETHSDHILNGVRLAIHDQKIEPDLVRVHFFGREEVNGTPRAAVSSPTIDINGRISEWPEGFFDEWDNSLSRLLLPSGFSLN